MAKRKPTELNDVAEVVRSVARLFRMESPDAKANAQKNLADITHYVDADTLQAFKSRILSARPMCSDLLFYIIESMPLGLGETKRGFRHVVFDVWGTIVDQPSADNMENSRVTASKAMWTWALKFDVQGYYKAELARRADVAKRESDKLAAAARTIRI